MKVAEIRAFLASCGEEDEDTDGSYRAFFRVLEQLWTTEPFSDNWRIPAYWVVSDMNYCNDLEHFLRKLENKLNLANPGLQLICELGKDLGIDDGVPYDYNVIIIRLSTAPIALSAKES
jgi:hypothetical protein